ncbi:unnamed protein product [Peronospora belbahrii]|uniref:Calcium uniporter protein C-terminal domain-containing protein n=1 Tax=Peronospora belbahrii TaxID=622444 RepID=A0AAU9KRD4_9STRA|nr:unnamed protein product [Peronospora belbahrii]
MTSRSFLSLRWYSTSIRTLRVYHSSSGSASTRTIQRHSNGQVSSQDLTRPHLSVRNAAKGLGQLDIFVPLPGLKGLTRLKIQDSSASVKNLIDTVKEADSSLQTVEIAIPTGTKVAHTVRLEELTSMAFCLRLNHVNILVENDATSINECTIRGEHAAFASVKAEIETNPRLLLPLQEFYRLCHNVGADETVATKWLRELQRRNLVVHFDQSRNPQLENAVILRPNSLESRLTLHNALDSELYNLKHDRRVKESELMALKRSLQKLQQVENTVLVAAHRLPNAQKWMGLTGLTGFYGILMYCVWDVYSWDVMEPITYFIGFTAVLGNSFYSTITKKDPTYSNIWQKRYAKRVAMLSQKRKHRREDLIELKARMTDLENDILLVDGFPPIIIV